MVPSSVKLRYAPLWPALAAVVAAALALWLLLPRILIRSASGQLLATAQMLAPLAAAETGPGLEAWVRRLPAGSDLRITIVRADGTVLADSARTPEQVAAMDNHAGRPEIRRALEGRRGVSVRRSATTGREYVYAARRFADAGGNQLLLRLAQPLDHLQHLRWRLAWVVAAAALAALAALAAVSWWVDRHLSRPLLDLIRGAGRLADGRFEHRLEIPEDDQLGALAGSLNRLAAGVEGQIAATRAERDHLRSILARMSDGVLVVGADGRAVLANPAFCRLFGLRGEVGGRPPLEIARQPRLARLIEATLAEAAGQKAELRLLAPERRTVALTSASLGAGEGAVVVARDTTAESRLAAIRRDFVANVSHELKTPLAAIRGYAETLRDGALDDRETAARFTGRILEQCRRLQALLDDLLTLSRLESVAALTETRPVELGPLAAHAAEVVAPAAAERGVEIRLEGDGAPAVEGDADALERLLVNLLDNAVKYNRPGGRATVRLREAGGEAVVEVADTGIGIPAEALTRVFERFYRVDKGRSRAEGGTGLGLAIVKHTAQLHGGRVEVESEEGRGSTFRVVLPLRRPG